MGFPEVVVPGRREKPVSQAVAGDPLVFPVVAEPGEDALGLCDDIFRVFTKREARLRFGENHAEGRNRSRKKNDAKRSD
jgi:hypothetical protein